MPVWLGPLLAIGGVVIGAVLADRLSARRDRIAFTTREREDLIRWRQEVDDALERIDDAMADIRTRDELAKAVRNTLELDRRLSEVEGEAPVPERRRLRREKP